MERDLKMTSFGPLVNVEHCRISTHWIWILNGYHSMLKMIRTTLSHLWPERTIASVMCYLCNLDFFSLTLFLIIFIVNSGVASPKKWGGPNNYSLLMSSKKLQYTSMGHPPIYKTLLNGFAQISGGVWTKVGVRTVPIPPVATPLIINTRHPQKI